MALASFKAISPPTEKRRRASDSTYSCLLKDSFSLTTLLVLGGVVQGVLSLMLPAGYALLPLVFLLLRAIVNTVRDLTSAENYALKRGVIPGRTSAQLPNTSYDPLRSEKASPFGSTPAEKGIVVLHLGARFNHPLGALAPGAKDFGDQFLACHKDLLKRAKEYGCLGGTSFRGDEAASSNTILTVYYFRNLEGLNRFAHDPVHRQAWDWYNRECLKKGYTHIGIFHEVFSAPPGAYETIYVNMQATMMAGGYANIKNEATGADEWVRSAVDASGPVWRSQQSRMGR